MPAGPERPRYRTRLVKAGVVYALVVLVLGIAAGVRPNNLLVLVFGDMSHAAAQRLRQLAGQAPVRCVQVVGPDTQPQAREHVRDPQGHLQGTCHVFGHAWAVVRPDGYLAATGESVDADLIQAIEQALGLKS